MFDNLTLSWKTFGVIAAIFFILLAFRNKRQATGDKTVVLERPSLAGLRGRALMAHAVLSTISGVLGFSVVAAIFCILLAIPLMLMGAKVELPEHVKEWPPASWLRSRMFSWIRRRRLWINCDKKEAIAEKLLGKKPEIVDPTDERLNAEWGGEPDPNPSQETILAELAVHSTRCRSSGGWRHSTWHSKSPAAASRVPRRHAGVLPETRYSAGSVGEGQLCSFLHTSKGRCCFHSGPMSMKTGHCTTRIRGRDLRRFSSPKPGDIGGGADGLQAASARTPPRRSRWGGKDRKARARLRATRSRRVAGPAILCRSSQPVAEDVRLGGETERGEN